MRLFLVLCILLLVLPISVSARDVIYLKDGRSVACEVTTITDTSLTFEITVKLNNGQQASSKRTVDPALVDYIEFSPIGVERAFLEGADDLTAEDLVDTWDKLRLHLGRARSNAGKIGIAYADALLTTDGEYHQRQALSVFDKVRAESWSEEDQMNAWQGRLRALIAMGDLEQALVESKEIAAQTDDPSAIIESTYLLAMADFERLKALEEENPRWMEDDLVLPERNALYHSTVDQLLWPFLFHGTREAVSARGLFAAAAVHQFAEKLDDASACLDDILALYPETKFAAQAEEKLGDPPFKDYQPTQPNP